MNIILVSEQFPPLFRGGLATHIQELALALERQGNTVKVITSSNSTKTICQRIGERIEVHRLAKIGLFYMSDLEFAYSAHKEIQKIKSKETIDGIQFSNQAGLFTFLVRDTSIPAVTKVHGGWLADLSIVKKYGSHEKLVNRFNTMDFVGLSLAHLKSKVIDRLCYNLSPHIIANNFTTKKELIFLFGIPERKISVVYNGVDHNKFNPYVDGEIFRKKLQVSSSPVVLYVGDFSSLKGFNYLPSIIKNVIKWSEKVTFVICGSYTKTSFLKALEIFGRSKLMPYVKLLGYVPREKMPNLLSASDILIAPSPYEVFGNVFIEALACGKPIVAFKTNELFKLDAERFCIPVELGDVKSFSDAVIELLENESLRRRLGNAAFTFSKNFSWEKTADQTLKVFNALRNESSARYFRGFQYISARKASIEEVRQKQRTLLLPNTVSRALYTCIIHSLCYVKALQ